MNCSMTYLEFHKQWHQLGVFNVQQIYAWQPRFNRLNLREWEKKGYIVKLRKEYYAFSDCRSIPGFTRYVANRIYRPSYISLHTALSYYGMIPEAVLQITSVTTLKTKSFNNDFGEYSYGRFYKLACDDFEVKFERFSTLKREFSELNDR